MVAQVLLLTGPKEVVYEIFNLISPRARDLESAVAHGFVKHGFKMLLHRVVDGPLQTSRCPVLQNFNKPRSFIPGIPEYLGPNNIGGYESSHSAGTRNVD